jgi:hypothetical protein
MYSNDEKTDMILIYGEFNKNAMPLRVAFVQTINIFPKTLRFFTTSFYQANDFYVKIYETAQLTVLCFLNQKTNIHVNFANVLCIFNSVGLIVTREILCILIKSSSTCVSFSDFIRRTAGARLVLKIIQIVYYLFIYFCMFKNEVKQFKLNHNKTTKNFER